MKIDPLRGGRCTHRLRVEVEDGVNITQDDTILLSVLFGDERVFRDADSGRAHVYLYMWTSLAVPKRTLRGAAYGDLLVMEPSEEMRLLAEKIGREILGCDVRLLMSRKPNGESRIVADCSLDDFEKACCS